MEQKMLTVPGLAVRNLRHRRVRTMFLAALVLILSAALFTSRVLTESMKTCIDKTVDRIGADVIVAPGEYESDLSDSLFSGGLCSFYFEKSLMDQVKKTDGIDKISPQLYIASLDAACCSVPVQIVAFEPESDFIVQPWMSGSNVSELKKGQTVVGSKITAKAGDKISFFGQEYEVAGKLEETGTSYDNCAFMNFETAYTLFDSFQKNVLILSRDVKPDIINKALEKKNITVFYHEDDREYMIYKSRKYTIDLPVWDINQFADLFIG